MRTISDHLGAWIVVGSLAIALVFVWGGDAPSRTYAGVDQEVCGEHTVAGVTLPQTQTWRPNPVLVGHPVTASTQMTSYELAEERSLARLELASGQEVASLAGYEGSSTSLNPIRMC